MKNRSSWSDASAVILFILTTCKLLLYESWWLSWKYEYHTTILIFGEMSRGHFDLNQVLFLSIDELLVFNHSSSQNCCSSTKFVDTVLFLMTLGSSEELEDNPPSSFFHFFKAPVQLAAEEPHRHNTRLTLGPILSLQCTAVTSHCIGAQVFLANPCSILVNTSTGWYIQFHWQFQDRLNVVYTLKLKAAFKFIVLIIYVCEMKYRGHPTNIPMGFGKGPFMFMFLPAQSLQNIVLGPVIGLKGSGWLSWLFKPIMEFFSSVLSPLYWHVWV